jgi:hypothetical protein
VRSTDPRLIAFVDGLALAAFVAVGTANHERAFSIGELASTAVPLIASWFATALAFGAYRRRDVRPLVWTWLVSVPVAAVLRSLWRGGPWDERLAVFASVALGFTALFVLAGRVGLGAVIRARQAPSSSRPRGPSSGGTS